MSTDSAIFLFFFLPLLLILEAVIRPVKAKNVFLCIAGLIFYAFGELWALALLIASALVNWALGLLAMRGRKYAVVLAAVLNLALLGVCKYLGFFGEGLSLLGLEVSLPDIIAPAGVSFFTFKGISYVADAYKRPETASRSFFRVLFYISFFPEVMSGPLSRFASFDAQLAARERSAERTASGLRRFILGLAKKLLLSGGCAVVADAAFGAGAALDARMAWLGAVAYSLQLYFDFSGYSDMAVGLGSTLGFTCPENFNHPFAATSITDFWRRWHISLSTWLKDYLYISLGGNRKGRFRTYVNLVVTMLLGGLWHGAAPRFVLWGGFHGLLLALHKFLMRLFPRMKATGADMKRGWRIAGIFVTFHLVCLGWIFFRARDVGTGADILEQVFTNFDISLIPNIITGYWEIFAMMLVGYVAHFTPRRLQERACDAVIRNPLAVNALLIVVIIWVVMQVKSADIQPFIYFQF